MCCKHIMSLLRIDDDAYKNGAGDVRCLVAGTEEKCDKWVHHLLAKVFGKSEETEHCMDWHDLLRLL